jgi:5-methylcytosine-specific restriction endonuclease McrA
MAKRFTDTEIWDREWFMDLPPLKKCLVKYVFDKCDICGVWKPNIKAASILIGENLVLQDLLGIDNGKHFKLINNKVFIPDFITFQYGKLSMTSRVHKAVVDLLIKNNLENVIENYLSNEDDIFISKRKRITQVKRDEIYSKDEYRCQYCGTHPDKYNLNIDHITPIDSGGDNEDENLTTICVQCNSKKKNMDVFDFIEKYKLKPLDNLSKKLDTISKKLDRDKDKEKDKDK